MPRPNILFIMSDDHAAQAISAYGHGINQTPNIDRLAKEGIRFEQFYVNSPICSPSRTAISTGQYPQRWKITSYLSNRDHNKQRGMAQWLDPKAPMLARSLQKAGYATGHFGKWHMGGQRNVADAPPITEYGFDQSLTNFEGMGPKLLPLTLKPGQDPDKPGRIWADAVRLGKGVRWMQRSRITEGFVEEAIPFIEKAQGEEKPFYLNLWPDDVHSPFWPPTAKWGDGSKRRLYLSVLEAMDEHHGGVGAKQGRHDGPTSVGKGHRCRRMAVVHDPKRVERRIALALQDERISRSPREVMAATMNKSTIMPTGPYWFLSFTAVPISPCVLMASPKEPTSVNSGAGRRGMRSALRVSSACFSCTMLCRYLSHSAPMVVGKPDASNASTGGPSFSVQDICKVPSSMVLQHRSM